jgi:hypothetical protein
MPGTGCATGCAAASDDSDALTATIAPATANEARGFTNGLSLTSALHGGSIKEIGRARKACPNAREQPTDHGARLSRLCNLK